MNGEIPNPMRANDAGARSRLKPRGCDVDRPRNLFIRDSSHVVISGVSLRDSGFWNLHLYRCPNVTIQILPKDSGGGPGIEGPFSLLTLPEPIPDIGYFEGPPGTFYIEDRERVRSWTLRFGMLTQQALNGEKSAEVIAEVVEQYR